MAQNGLMLLLSKKKGGFAGKEKPPAVEEEEEEPEAGEDAGLAHAESFVEAVGRKDADGVWEHFKGMKRACEALGDEGEYDEEDEVDEED